MARRGRPRLPPTERKTAPVPVRLHPELRARLDKSRAKNKTTLSGEIQARLRASFHNEAEEREATFGGPTNYALFIAMSWAVNEVCAGTGQMWWEDRFTWEHCRAAVVEIFDHFRPTGARAVPEAMLRPAGDHRAVRQQLRKAYKEAPLGAQIGQGAIALIEAAVKPQPFSETAEGNRIFRAAGRLFGKMTNRELERFTKGESR